MTQKIKKYWKLLSSDGQNMIEYLVVFAGVIFVLVAIVGPTGIFTQRIEESMDTAFEGTKCLALQVCYDPDGCPSVDGNGCCEAGETAQDNPGDCSVCTTDSDCDDGIECTGDETCDRDAGVCRFGEWTCYPCSYGIEHGGSGYFYETATVPYGTPCPPPVERFCNNGTFDPPSPTNPDCEVLPPAGCDGYDHGEVGYFYTSATVDCGTDCIPVTQVCQNGTWDRGYTAEECEPDCVVCIGPDGTEIAEGESEIYYTRPLVECWNYCSSAQVNVGCDENGNLTGDPAAIYTDCEKTDPECPDNIACTRDYCDTDLLENMGCVHTPDDGDCNDEKTCTGIEDSSVLLAQDPTRLNAAGDGDDWCEASLGCQFQRHDEWCLDLVDCTSDRCLPTYNWSDPVTGCYNAPDHNSCREDPDIRCTGNVCIPPDDPTELVSGCRTLPQDDWCQHSGNCAFGTCEADPATDDGCHYVWETPEAQARCNDGFDCTTGEACVQDGLNYVCTPATGTDYSLCTDDGNPCTESICTMTEGCNPPVDCSDTDPCTIDSCDRYDLNGDGDICVNEVMACDSGPACSTGTCVDGQCEYVVIDCDDGNVCNGVETCSSDGSGCQAGTPLNCPANDGDACNGVETCSNALGGCGLSAPPMDCDDGLSCTDDSCVNSACINDDTCVAPNLCTTSTCQSGGVGGFCFEQGTICPDDGNACTVEACDVGTGACVAPPKDCTDSDPCTRSIGCDQTEGCQYIVTDCPVGCHCEQSGGGLPLCIDDDTTNGTQMCPL